MVAATHRQHPRPPCQAARAEVLQRHLDRHLDRHGARVAQEDALQRCRRDLRQPLAQLDRGTVRQPAEHHVRHPRDLRPGDADECMQRVCSVRAACMWCAYSADAVWVQSV